jgi:hypothetical protein
MFFISFQRFDWCTIVVQRSFINLSFNIYMNEEGNETNREQKEKESRKMKKRKKPIWAQAQLQESVEIVPHHQMGSKVEWCMTEYCDR